MGQTQCCCCMEEGKRGETVQMQQTEEKPMFFKDELSRPPPEQEVKPVDTLPTVASEATNPIEQQPPPPVAEEPAPVEPVQEATDPKQNLGQFTITVRRLDGHKLGMTVGTHETHPDMTKVREIKPGGLLDAWNANNPSWRLESGDQVVEVNGARSPDAILKALADQSQKEVVLLVNKQNQDQ
mmetsp:Transcript_12189/g.22473  ORF Transcript_12189/g.22473 Transcript_12189/m.22473 type:complete len:183 (+) Transcript_12189:81-629(+)